MPGWRVSTRCRRSSTWMSSTPSGMAPSRWSLPSSRFDGNKVALVDGSRLDPDVVICATGYRRDLEPLVGHLGVLDANGKPLVQGEKPAAEGLRFIGFMSRPSFIGYVAKQSKRMAKRIASELR